MIAKHLIRMASTRSKARCLRDLCNISIVAVEELADFDDVIGTGQSKKTSRKKAAGKGVEKEPKTKPDSKKKSPVKDKPEPKAKSKQPKEPERSEPKVEPEEKTASTQPNMSEAQKRAIYNLSRRRGISVEDLEKMATDAYQCELENLNSKDASAFIRNLQQAA
jgi:outer membrane biosynthesis protein TonB